MERTFGRTAEQALAVIRRTKVELIRSRQLLDGSGSALRLRGRVRSDPAGEV